MPKQKAKLGRNWYALHTYSGYEESVAKNLRRRIKSMDMEDKIFKVMVPKEKKMKIKNGQKKVVEERIFPGYVLVNMVVTDETWYIARNTPNVTGFIGAGNMPVPISPEEIKILKEKTEAEEPEYKIDVKKGDVVKINDGPFKGYEGKIEAVDKERGKVKVLVDMFGRDTPVELDFLQVDKI